MPIGKANLKTLVNSFRTSSMIQEETRQRIKILFAAIMHSTAEIIRVTEIPQSTVYRILKRIKDNKSMQHKKGAGHPVKTTYRLKQAIITIIIQSPKVSVRDLRSKLSNQCDPGRPKCTSGGHFVFASRGAEIRECASIFNKCEPTSSNGASCGHEVFVGRVEKASEARLCNIILLHINSYKSKLVIV